jgi:hypothetical protein
MDWVWADSRAFAEMAYADDPPYASGAPRWRFSR